MRLLIAAAVVLALVPLAVQASATAQPVSIPVFGPSVHLIDPSPYPASDPQYPRQPLPDAEPSVAVAPDGTVWVAAIHMKYGTALWRGRFGVAPPAFAGMPDHGIGGADVALALGAGTPSTLYTASLVPITTPVTAFRIAATACPGGVVGFDFQACSYEPHLAYGRRDRPWLATYGRSTVYLSYLTRGENELSGHMTVRRSDDGGRTWRQLGDPVAGLGGTDTDPVHGWPGPLAVDARSGAVYEAFVTDMPATPSSDRFNRIVVAISHDSGATWRDSIAYQGGPHEDDGNMWPGLAIDAAGRLYAAWSDRLGVYLTCSANGGVTWTPPRRVDAPSALLQTSVLPWVAAGAPGHVALAWYGTSAPGNLGARTPWRVWYAESFDGGRTFGTTPVTGVIHRGPICTKGDECPWVQRQMLDNFGLALDPHTGRAAIAYSRSIEFGDYLGCRRAANCPQTYYVEETGYR